MRMPSTAQTRWVERRIPGPSISTLAQPYPPGTFPTVSYGTAFGNLFNGSAPDKGVGVNINVTLRNRTAQADQARSQMEYRQTEMRLQQLYAQIRIQVIEPAVCADQRPGPGRGGTGGAGLCGAEPGRGREEVQAGSFDDDERVAAGEEPGGCGEYADLGRQRRMRRTGRCCVSFWRTRWRCMGSASSERGDGSVGQTPVIPGLTAPKAPEAPKPISVTPNTPPQQ